ncbi:DUF4422 domain-containing protein [Vagococcus lutrae]|uniref:DUF4422 domain-containing protein n=1 Tax=Vagococcus lutrae TaxID=81947 RepID=UPI0023A9A7D4|nr:DUF4422 domain-containing protein [Vagococcus lutrae]WEB81765.1 DUF4422 domain-containing protein [Vagococcus lutrae]
MNGNVFVVTHKNYSIPSSNTYVPIIVGKIAEDNILLDNYCRDNTGDNISEKNPNYCELTALYWIWKNIDADYVGLVHYRRHFFDNIFKKNINKVVDNKEIVKHLHNVDMILPKKRNYFIETNYNHYKNAHYIKDLDEALKIIIEKYPEYQNSIDLVMSSTKGHRYNMLISKKTCFDKYADWLFDILFELEKRIDIDSYDDYQQRVYGFISERLLDIWLLENEIAIKEMNVKFIEKQNWIKKSYEFMKRKIIGGLKNDK